jgi:hypothetical protein
LNNPWLKPKLYLNKISKKFTTKYETPMIIRFPLEFMDESWLPHSIRTTVLETLNVVLAKPFRPYYDDVVEKTIETINRKNIRRVAELGAGAAPISRHLAKNADLPKSVKISPSDKYPDIEGWKALEESFPAIVECNYDSMDFTKPMAFPPDTLLLLSASFHHVPFQDRVSTLKALIPYNVLICEPIRRNYYSIAFTLLGLFPALLAPIALLKRPGRFRRFLWGWLIPIAPIIIVWDGLASCFRCWTEKEWELNVKNVAPNAALKIHSTVVTTYISW